MRGSKSLTAVLAVALLLSNMACACASNAAAGGGTDSVSGSDPVKSEHHHSASEGTTGDMPCAHHDCDGCEELQDTCTTPDYIPVSAERDSRATASAQVDLDSSDLELIFPGTGPPAYSSFSQLELAFDRIATVVPPDTPVHRKDQLIE